MAVEHWGFFCVPHLLWHGASPRTSDTSTYCWAFSSVAVTTCFYDLGLSRLWFEHRTFRLRWRHEEENKYCMFTIRPCPSTRPGGHEIYNLDKLFFGHHYYTLSLSDQGLREENKIRNNSCSLYDLFGHALAQEFLPWESWNLQYWWTFLWTL